MKKHPKRKDRPDVIKDFFLSLAVLMTQIFCWPIVAVVMLRPICLPKRVEELLHKFVLPGLRNHYMNQFQARRGLRHHMIFV
jgi:hypothetical protein